MWGTICIIGLLIITIIGVSLTAKKQNILNAICVIFLVILSATALSIAVLTGISYESSSCDRAALVEERMLLDKQLEDKKVDGTVIVKAIDFNIKLMNGKAVSHDDWFGWFFPNIYDDIEPLEID